MEAEGTSGAGEILEVLEVWPPDHCLEDQAEAGTEAGTVEETVEDVVGAGVVEDSSYMTFDIKICYECSEHILSIKCYKDSRKMQDQNIVFQILTLIMFFYKILYPL